MKKIILLTCLTGALMAESSFYVGLDVGKADNTDKITSKSDTNSATVKNDNSYSDIKIKLGIEADIGTDFQLIFSKIDYSNGLLNNNTGPKYYTGTQLYEIGLDIIKKFELTSSFSPFIKLGVGYGYMDSQFPEYGDVNEFSTNFGVGLSYKVIEHIYALAGVDYIYRHWSNTSDTGFTYETRGSAIKPYVGLNYKF